MSSLVYANGAADFVSLILFTFEGWPLGLRNTLDTNAHHMNSQPPGNQTDEFPNQAVQEGSSI